MFESREEFEIELGLSRDVAEGLNGLEVGKDLDRSSFLGGQSVGHLGEGCKAKGHFLTLFGFPPVIERERHGGDEGQGRGEPDELEAGPKRSAAGLPWPRFLALDGLKDENGKIGGERGVRERSECIVEGALFVEAGAQGGIAGEGAVENGLVVAGKRSTNGIQDMIVFVCAVHRFHIENRGLRKVSGFNRSMRRF